MYLEGLDGLLVCESLKSLAIHLQNFITWKGECNQYIDTQTDVYSCMQRFWHPVSKFLQVIKWKKGLSYLKIWDFWSYQRFLDHLPCTALWDLFTDIFFSTLAFSDRCSYVCFILSLSCEMFPIGKKKKKKINYCSQKCAFWQDLWQQPIRLVWMSFALWFLCCGSRSFSSVDSSIKSDICASVAEQLNSPSQLPGGLLQSNRDSGMLL